MICKNCGRFNPDSEPVCADCGMPLDASYYPQGNGTHTSIPRYTPVIPPEYRPLSPWAYFGYQLLFAIPVVGFILLIVFSCGGTSNLNLKNFARSYWCGLMIGLIVAAILVVLIIAMGGASILSDFLRMSKM